MVTDAQAHLKNITYYAKQLRELAKGQFETDSEGLNFLASEHGADYLAGLAEIDAYAAKIEFFTQCIEFRLEHCQKIRPPVAIML